MNKVMAAAGRREVRDLVDLVAIHETILPLGAAEIRPNANYPASQWRALAATEPIDPNAVTPRLRAALDDAEAFVSRMPTGKIGLLFLHGGKVVQPEPDRLESYQTHAGQRRGQWPSSPEITAAMIRALQQKTKSIKPRRASLRRRISQNRNGI